MAALTRFGLESTFRSPKCYGSSTADDGTDRDGAECRPLFSLTRLHLSEAFTIPGTLSHLSSLKLSEEHSPQYVARVIEACSLAPFRAFKVLISAFLTSNNIERPAFSNFRSVADIRASQSIRSNRSRSSARPYMNAARSSRKSFGSNLELFDLVRACGYILQCETRGLNALTLYNHEPTYSYAFITC